MPCPEGIPDAEVSAEGYEAHVHDTSWTSEDVAGHVNIAPYNTERPVTWNINKDKQAHAISKR